MSNNETGRYVRCYSDRDVAAAVPAEILREREESSNRGVEMAETKQGSGRKDCDDLEEHEENPK